MKIIVTILSISLLVSCNKEDTPVPHPNLGNYELISLTSDTALDLNYDNIKSENFKEELSVYYTGFRKPMDDLIFTESTYDANKWYFRLSLPRDFYYPELGIIDLRYSDGDYSKIVFLKDGKIDRIAHYYYDGLEVDADFLINEHYPYPYDLILNSGTMVTVKVKQMFFDLEQDLWVLVNLEAVFEKVVE
ncbi:MAG: hypothetical protein WA839_08400 [Flavobacteriaceae bacterium]